VEQLSLVDLARVLRDCPQCLHPLFVAGGERADRPVAAEEHAVPAEAGDRMIDERAQVVRGPSFGIRIGYEAGDLARDIRKAGDFRNVSAPRVEIFFHNLRYSAVVKDENYIRAFGD